MPFIHGTFSSGAFVILSGLDDGATVPPTMALVAKRFGRTTAAAPRILPDRSWPGA